MDTDVLIVGAGPTGLMMAEELRVAGVSAVLVDKLPQRSDLSRAGGVQSRTLAALDQRGLMEPLLARGDFPKSAGHFAGIQLPLDNVGDRLPWRSVPQVDIEAFFEDHLAAHGIRARRDHELVDLAQDGDGVTTAFANGTTIRSRYVVAADGAHSKVRSLLRADFPGRPGIKTVIAADVRLAGAGGEMSHTWSDDGTWVALFPLGTDPQGRPLTRLVVGGPGRSVPRDTPITEEELRDGLRTVFDDRVQLLELRYSRRITNAARQAAQYRHGRVFLAGDAAHVHLPLGAQGMNTGIQDAVNLGWKLGAAVHGWAPPRLLDTYHDERHPVGAAVLRNVQAQSLIMDWLGTRDPDVMATRSLFQDLAQLPAVQRRLGDLLSGTAIRYEMPGVDTGHAASDVDGLHELLRSGRGVLFDPADQFGKIADLWSDRVDRVTIGTPMLVRPDGYVCWAGDPDELEPALGRWFGEPR
ncbi:FAD-dependent monooxygenase [Kutzneria sp. 744]|uniref:FAD-dependent monooxygenase n=1 Tax=Kutzneria sp. (strain 744) TaxID=345341 RepID=UPI0003EED3AF|nr:FAD-dependent monooxygenase [Kutzneria sp. 744]EWM10544.1 flavin-type hydroxylase [Kutzneria sp. 744]